MSELRQTPLQRALHRENLLMGGERELVMFTALIAGGLIITAQNLAAVAAGVPLWVICLFLLRAMAKADPYLSKVYTRQLHYRDHYAPRSSPFLRP